MGESKAQASSERPSHEQLKRMLLADLPALERLVKAIRTFCDPEPAITAPSPCDSCPGDKREDCSDPCELLEACLPKVYAGKIHSEGTINFDFNKVREETDCFDNLEEENIKPLDYDVLRNIRKVSSLDIFSQYEACWHIFSKKQREALARFHRDGKTMTEIAAEIGKAKSTVWGRLNKAEERKKEYYRKQLNNDLEVREREWREKAKTRE